MAGRLRKDVANCVARKRRAPIGFSSLRAAQDSQRWRSDSAARLSELAGLFGDRVPLEWVNGDYHAFARAPSGEECRISRPLLGSWAARGWARLAPAGKGRSVLEIDLYALPGDEEG